jgi:hypothetical protein
MSAIAGKFFGDELTKLWGLKGCRDIKIHIPLNGIVVITVEFNPTKEQMEQCESILKQYRLEEIPEEGKVT